MWGLLGSSWGVYCSLNFFIFLSHAPFVCLSTAIRESRSMMPFKASLASPMTRVTVSTFLSTSLLSMSMWTTFAPGEKSSRRAVVLSDILAPTTRRTSASETMRFASPVPCIPQRPVKRGWSLDMAPFPIRVVVTGATSMSASFTSSAEAFDAMTPPPAMMTGLWALERRVAAQSISRGLGSGFSL